MCVRVDNRGKRDKLWLEDIQMEKRHKLRDIFLSMEGCGWMAKCSDSRRWGKEMTQDKS
jgi:hypothetical protein